MFIKFSKNRIIVKSLPRFVNAYFQFLTIACKMNYFMKHESTEHTSHDPVSKPIGSRTTVAFVIYKFLAIT